MISEYGLRPNRFPEILNNYDAALQAEFGNAIDTSYNSLLGSFINLLALGETRLVELSQTCYDSSNIFASEGILLENLALLSGFTRNPATSSRGVVYLTGADGKQVPSGTVITSILGNNFVIESDTTITSTYCVGCRVSINNFRRGLSYTLEVGDVGNTNVYRTDVQDFEDKLEVIEALHALVIADEELINSFVDVVEGEPYLVIVKTNTGTAMSVQGGSFFTFTDVTVTTLVAAESSGNIPNNAFSISTTILGDVFVENRDNFQIGVELESDAQLRERVLDTFRNSSQGSSYIAMETALRMVPDVTYVKVSENDSFVPMGLPSRLPPKSFQVIVENGDPVLIAEAIWQNKPSGILNYCDITNPLTQTVNIQDFNEQSHIVRFLRPQTVFVWIHAEYTINPEEPLLASTEIVMRESLAGFGQTLQIGNDVIPDRFYSSVYTNVSGIDDLRVYVATTTSINDVPVFPVDYTTNVVPITDEQLTNFSAFGDPPRTTVRSWGTGEIPVNPPTFDR